jgi:excisionase family DNA binding protein
MLKHSRNETHDKAKEYLLQLEEVANLLKVEVTTVKDWVRSNRLPYSHIGPGRDMQFRMDDVMAFILIERNERWKWNS